MEQLSINIYGTEYVVTASGQAYQVNPFSAAVRDAIFFRDGPREWVTERGDPIAMTLRYRFEDLYQRLIGARS